MLKPRDLLIRKRQLYRSALDTPDGKRLLGDLARFCHYSTTTHVPGDPYSSAVLVGRREVYMRMLEGMNISDAQINALRLEEERQQQEGDE